MVLNLGYTVKSSEQLSKHQYYGSTSKEYDLMGPGYQDFFRSQSDLNGHLWLMTIR